MRGVPHAETFASWFHRLIPWANGVSLEDKRHRLSLCPIEYFDQAWIRRIECQLRGGHVGICVYLASAGDRIADDSVTRFGCSRGGLGISAYGECDYSDAEQN